MADYDDRRRDREDDWQRRREYEDDGESGSRDMYYGQYGQNRGSDYGRGSNWRNRRWAGSSRYDERGRTSDEEFYRNYDPDQEYGSGQRYGSGDRYRSSQEYRYGTSDDQQRYGSGRGQGQTGRGRYWGRGPQGYARSDDRIREDVNDRLTWHGDIDATEIQVMVDNGEVTLEGRVEERNQKRMAEDAAAEVWGVKDVHNRLKVDQSLGEQIREGINNLTGNQK